MTAEILTSRCGRSVFFSTETKRAFGPIFPSLNDAEKFKSFVHLVTIEHLSWGSSHDQGEFLYELWKSLGKPEKRPCPKFKPDSLCLLVKEWGFSGNLMEDLFPLFLCRCPQGNNTIGEILKKDGVLGDGTDDPEFSFYRAYFKSKKQGVAFIKRLNSWLEKNWHRAYEP